MYEDTGKEIVHALKYRGYRAVVERVMAPLMTGTLDGERRFEAVVPVPLHRSRLRRRGFNQAELMARAVAKEINVPLSDKMEVVRKTRDQVELTAPERKTNVSGAFRLREPARQDFAGGRRVHDRRHHERVCGNPRPRRRLGGACSDPVQDGLKRGHGFQTSARPLVRLVVRQRVATVARSADAPDGALEQRISALHLKAIA